MTNTNAYANSLCLKIVKTYVSFVTQIETVSNAMIRIIAQFVISTRNGFRKQLMDSAFVKQDINSGTINAYYVKSMAASNVIKKIHVSNAQQ